jgi:hypothetical protein
MYKRFKAAVFVKKRTENNSFKRLAVALVFAVALSPSFASAFTYDDYLLATQKAGQSLASSIIISKDNTATLYGALGANVSDAFDGIVNYLGSFFGGQSTTNNQLPTTTTQTQPTKQSVSPVAPKPITLPIPQPKQIVTPTFKPTTVPPPTTQPQTTQFITQRILSGVTSADLELRIQQLRNELTAKIGLVSTQSQSNYNNNFAAIALTNKIDQLQNTVITSPAITGGTITNTNISGGTISGTTISGTTLTVSSGIFSGNLTVSGTATSTFAGDSNFDGGTLYIDSLNNRVGVGTSSPSDTFSLAGPLYLSQISAPSVTTNRLYNTGGSIYWNGTALGAGGGGTSSWATTTSQVSGRLINYSLNTTDIVTIGASSTTTAPFFFDPNTTTGYISGKLGIGTTSPYAKLSVVGEVVAANFTATSTTATSTFFGALVVDVPSSAPSSYLLFNGPTDVASTDSVYIDLNARNTLGTSGRVGIKFQSNGVDRWRIRKSTGVELGGNVASNFELCSVSDAGADLPCPLIILRATGVATFSGGITSTGVVISNGGIANTGTITSTGNVGIGTTSPYAALSVVGETVSSYFTATSTTATSTFANNISIASGKDYRINGAPVITSGGRTIGTGNTNTGGGVVVGRLNSATGAAASLAIGDSNIASGINAVAIGYTAQATSSVDVAIGNAANAGGSNSLAIGISVNAYALNSVAIGNSITNTTASSLMIGPSDAAKLTILSSGNVGIGTTSPSAMLHIGSATAGGNVRIANGWLCVDNNDTCTGAATAGTVYAVGAYTTGADLAENYQAFEDGLAPGNLVSLTTQNTTSTTTDTTYGVKKGTQGASLLGIVSTKPGLLLGNGPKEMIPVALSGRVPAKVSLEGGDILPGDHITISGMPGVGMKATSSSYTVGIALEPFTSSSPKDGQGVGSITVFTNVGWSHLDSSISNGTIGHGQSSFWDIDESSGRIKYIAPVDFNDFDIVGVKAITGSAGKWSIDANGNLVVNDVQANKVTAQEVTSQVFCIDDVCVDKDKLKAMLGGSVQGGGSSNIQIQPQDDNPITQASTTESITSTSSSSVMTTQDIVIVATSSNAYASTTSEVISN